MRSYDQEENMNKKQDKKIVKSQDNKYLEIINSLNNCDSVTDILKAVDKLGMKYKANGK